jgi:signal transduction histidine kinase
MPEGVKSGSIGKTNLYICLHISFQEANNSGRLHVEMYIFGKVMKFKQDREAFIFGIVQGIITNAMKHAKASTLFL